MAHLAIAGHPTRGKEVIELFKMMGGCECGYCGGGTGIYYYISQFGNIEASCKPTEFDTYIVYTLEEFLEKYPYKVGDKVVINDIDICTIQSLYWDISLNKVCYILKTSNGLSKGWCTEELLPYEESKPMKEKKINQMSLANCDLDEIEIVLGDKFELKIKEGKYYAVRKKSQYPTDYIDACSVLGISVTSQCEMDVVEYGDELYALYQLLVCRDAYWYIAGMNMGLGKSWKPDWKNIYDKHCIYVVSGEIWLKECQTRQCTLAFPTAEMRDAFYENFKDLIGQCKELL